MTVRKFSEIRLRLPPKYEDLRGTFDTLLRYMDEVSKYIDTADIPPGPPIPPGDEFSISIAGGDVSYSGANGARTSSSRTVSVVGGVDPITFAWTIENNPGNTGGELISVTSPAAATTTFASDANDAELTAEATVTVTDADGNVLTASISITAIHGLPP